ncbi:protein DDI1 homolog 2 isoform X1 [Stegastes partitus]|uniref:Fibrous sheath CABYR-binding protein-like isoform X1 n=1 Tax=Stegastes partitus TaxID=144197 RepID=A0A3B4ZFC6_9TELE|nr:PREDICTED: fibrous sheath CABYR-binding protein-like isoform X1 [Stegastes partitus]XP_008287224.1 PREDICTED: fibrous sheath CABYR-binding protein-like isoform X1 [Stegastes partitus]
MLVTVFCAPRDRPETTFALDVSPDLELRDFVALCELESGIPAGEIQITYVEQPLKDPTRALGTYGVKDGDVVVLRQADRRPPPTQPAFPGLPHIDFRSITVPSTSSSTSQRGAIRPQQQASQPPQPQPQPVPVPVPQSLPQPLPQSQSQPQPQPQRAAQPSTPMAFRGSSPQGLDDPALLQQMLLSNPHELSLLKERNPPLAEALLSGDLERFTKVLLEQQQDRARREQERIRLLTADPFDLEAQAKIEEDIRQHNVEENMTIAMEEAPESFGQVVMLYINCKVNGHPVKAFVDSGAQMTIMSQACAERCNIMRLVDRRWAGIAKGVGTQKIIGRVHLAQVQIEGDFLPCSFSILEDQPMDMLLGLDMLKRHQCSIDLKKSVLLIGTTGTETRFLSEAELPECARLAYGAEGREDARPDEIADRELAEALQRSIQESDTADGQTTSPQPPPFTLPRSLDQMSSPASPSQSPSSGQTLDRSQSAPAAMEQASALGQCQARAGFRELPQPSSPAEDAASTPHPAHPHPLPLHSNSEVPPLPSPSTDVLRTCTPPADMTTVSQDPGGEVQPGDAKGESDEEANPSMCSFPEQLSPIQPMEQEATESDAADTTEACPSAPSQPDSVEMESPTASHGVVSSERDQPDGERCSSSDSIPSLAAALMELHELLVSNNHAQSQNRSSSCSPSHPFRQDADRASPEPCTPTSDNTQPTPSTAITAGAEPSDAKANYAAAVSDEEPSKCLVPDLSGQDDHLGVDAAETVEGRGPPQCPDGSGERRADRCGQEEACNVSSICQPEPEVPPDPAGDLEFREPPEGQHGRGVADGQASGTNTPDTLGLQTEHTFLSPLSMAVGSPEEVSSTSSVPPLAQAPQPSSPAHPLPSPAPFIEQFPAEHIQRIQAAGFSAREAAEALEQAHGVVELALLALLARSITVPT